MKRIVVLSCVLALSAAGAVGQRHHIDRGGYGGSGRTASADGIFATHEGNHHRKGWAPAGGVDYRNAALTWQTITLAGENTLVFSPVLKGVAFTSGHSFLVHEKPLFGVFHLGVDATWFDAEYGNWRQKIDGDEKWMHKFDMSVGGGPALHVSPFDRFGIHAYFRYNPTLSLVTPNFAGDEDGKFEIVAGYASYFSAGLALSWSVFSVGGEYRYGGGVYRGLRIPDVTISPEEIDIDELLGLRFKDALDRQRHRMHGWRAYVSFRF